LFYEDHRYCTYTFCPVAIFNSGPEGYADTERCGYHCGTGTSFRDAGCPRRCQAQGNENPNPARTSTISAFNQSIPGGFAMIFSGQRYRIELENPFQPIKQIFDGKDTVTLMPNAFKLPPIDRTGFYVLGRIGDPTYPVTALPETAKKKGFRMTSPDGRFTDFYVDEKTKQVKGYDSAFDFGTQAGTTSVEVDKYRTVDGVLVPEKFAQRFDLGQITAYCEFKAKDILVNTPIADEVFTMAK